jgi:hypothetical protein
MTQEELNVKWDEIVDACEEHGDDPYPAWAAFLVNFGEQHPIPGSFDFIKYSFDIKENHATRQHTVSIHA